MDKQYSFRNLSRLEKLQLTVGSVLAGVVLGCVSNYLPWVGETGELNLVDKLGHTLLISAISLGMAAKSYHKAPAGKRLYEQEILKRVPLTGAGAYIGLELMNYLI